MQTEFAREQMLTQQVRAWEVLDPGVLALMARVPREPFVPPGYREVAFADTEIPLPCGQRMLAPKVVGRILQALALSGSERVLEVGTGSGYLTACLAAAASQVTSLEIWPEIADFARTNLRSIDASGAEIITADVYQHVLADGFDAIVLTGSLPTPDPRFERRLAVGGRMFAVVGEPPIMDARLIRRVDHDRFAVESLFETVLPPLIGASRRPAFEF